MKKETIKQILIFIGSLAFISIIAGFIQVILSFDNFLVSKNISSIAMSDDSYNSLLPFVIVGFIFNLIIMGSFIALAFLKYIKNEKTRIITQKVLYYVIVILSFINLIITRCSLFAGYARYSDDGIHYYSSSYISYSYYLQYQNILTSVLSFTIPALILVACIVVYKFIEKKETKVNKTIENEEKASENQIDDTKKDGN